MPRSEMLVEVAGAALSLALLLSFMIAWVLRRLFGARLSLPLSVMTIVSLLEEFGLFLAGWFFVGLRLWMPTALLLAVGSSLGLSFLVAGIAALLRRDGAIDVAALLERGESDRVEFKETARWNVRDDKKDARMEQVVAKTVAAFLNSSGGTLLIGVDDAGRVHGLDRDFATLRTPDADRFELWLRRHAGDEPRKERGRHAAHPLRRDRRRHGLRRALPASTRARLRRPGRRHRAVGAGRQLTRAFGVDEAVTYVARHFRPNLADLLLGRR